MGLGGGDGFMKGGGSGAQGMFGNLFGEREGMFEGVANSMRPHPQPPIGAPGAPPPQGTPAAPRIAGLFG